MSHAKIQVYAQFPTIPSDLRKTAWQWFHCLTFPVDTLASLRLSRKPYKWIRFATGVVVGTLGHLSHEPHSLRLVDYEDETPPSETLNLYYIVTEEERLHMFPVDPDFLNPRTMTGTASTRRVGFKHEMIARDGERCAVTRRFPVIMCDGVHLIAHSKGDDYITTLTERRARLQGSTSEIVDTIDDVRNGLLLNKSAHGSLGLDFAILKIPNFALETSDVVLGGTGPKYIAQLLNFDNPQAFGNGVDPSDNFPTSLEVRTPSAEHMSKWPPDVIFNVVYASAVSNHFGEVEQLQEALSRWGSELYPLDGPMTASERQQKEILDRQTRIAEKRAVDSADRAGRVTKRRKMDGLDFVMWLPYVNAMRGEVERYERVRREHMEEAAANAGRAVCRKVESWRSSIPPPLSQSKHHETPQARGQLKHPEKRRSRSQPF